MVANIASMGVLLTANAEPATREMDKINKKVKDVGQASQKEGAKTEGFMKQWAGGFAAIGAAAAGSLYMIVKASPLLSGAMQEAQDAISLLFMTIGDALEPIIRPFVDMLWGLVDVITDMPAPLDVITSTLILFGSAITIAGVGLGLLAGALHAFGIGAATAGAHAALFVGIIGGIIFAAGAAAAALYYLSGDPVVAIVGAFTVIGTAAFLLMHNPVVAAITALVGAFVLIMTTSGDLQLAVVGVFTAIGIAASILLHNPVILAFTAIVDAIYLIINYSDEMETAVIGVFTAIGLAASVLLANPVIAAIVLIVDAIYLLINAFDELKRTLAWRPSDWIKKLIGYESPFEHELPFMQHGGYVPFTGPAFLHAGEYVVPAGRAGGGGAGGGYADNRTFNFEINNPILAGDMDVARLKQRLDELYKQEMGEAP